MRPSRSVRATRAACTHCSISLHAAIASGWSAVFSSASAIAGVCSSPKRPLTT